MLRKYYYGNEISAYGRENGRVDYRTFAKSFNHVLNNGIMAALENAGYYFEQTSGFIDNSDEIEEIEEEIEKLEDHISEIEEKLENMEESEESDAGREKLENQIEEIKEKIDVLEDEKNDLENADSQEIFQYYIVPDDEILKENNEIVFYCEDLDLYIWGVTHYGTAWDYVLTDIECEKEGD